MSELKTVNVDRLQPNPFRDGSGGAATWGTVRESYPMDPKKLEQLRASFRNVGVWEGIIARPSGGSFQIAFGHHRVVAAVKGVEAGELKDGLPIIVKNLSDDEMLRYMAQENNEDYEHSFLFATMNPIEAVVRAYAEGKIALEKPEENAPSKIREAPSFISGRLKDGFQVYSAASVARYLGWTHTNPEAKGGVSASQKVQTALMALELIERKVLERKDFFGLTPEGAKTVVEAYRQRVREKTEEIKAEVRVHEQAKVKAEKQGDTNKADAEARRIEAKEAKIGKIDVSEAKNVAQNVAQQLQRPEAVIAEVRRNVGLDRPRTEAPRASGASSVSEIRDGLILLANRVFNDNENWQKVLKASKGSKGDKELEDAMDRLKGRVTARLKELRERVA